MINILSGLLAHTTPFHNDYLSSVLVIQCEIFSQSPCKECCFNRYFDLPNAFPRKRIHASAIKNSIERFYLK